MKYLRETYRYFYCLSGRPDMMRTDVYDDLGFMWLTDVSFISRFKSRFVFKKFKENRLYLSFFSELSIHEVSGLSKGILID